MGEVMSLRVQKGLVKYWRALRGLVLEMEHKTDHRGLLYKVASFFGRRSRKPGPVYWPFKGSARPKEIDCGSETWVSTLLSHNVTGESAAWAAFAASFLVASPPLPFALEWRRCTRSRSGCRLVHIACSVCVLTHMLELCKSTNRVHTYFSGVAESTSAYPIFSPPIYPVGVYYPV